MSLFFSLFPICTSADDLIHIERTVIPSAITILENVAQQVPVLMKMVTAIAYLIGIYFVFLGILKLKQFGEQRTMMSTEHHLKGPLIFIGIGAVLLYLPTSVQIGMSTFWTNPIPYAYVLKGAGSPWEDFLKNCFLVMQFFGTIAFIRGLILLSRLGQQQGGGQGHFGKGLMHVIGGIFCINIYQFIQVITSLFGISTS